MVSARNPGMPFGLLRLPRPYAGAPETAAKPLTRVMVFGKFPNPTFDYYFQARLTAPGMPPFDTIDIRSADLDSVDAEGVFVIIVRYLSGAMANWIRKNRGKLSGVALFVDDDIAGVITGMEASLAYRYRLLTQSIWPLRRLDGLIDELWVSTEMLSRRLAYASPSVLPPAPVASVSAPYMATLASSTITVAYHATAIHVEEHRFLAPIIRDILAKHASVRFEVFAEGRSADLWHALKSDRITVRPPLPWISYLKESQRRHIDIMLVPVAPGHVNDCRADTKRIDIARVGAAALLSDCPSFRQSGDHGLLPYDRQKWTEALDRLIRNADERLVAASDVRHDVAMMADRARAGIPTIMRRA
jgi:hypothetical protein